jgi:hypothetical protein
LQSFNCDSVVSANDAATHLAETAVNTFSHVNIVTSCTSAAISALFSFDGDCLSWADSLAQLASDASLLAARVSSQSMLAAETGAQRSLLEWVVDGSWFLEDVSEGDSHTTSQLGPENRLSCTVGDVFELHALLGSIHIVESSMR